MHSRNVHPNRAWNTWDAAHPARLIYLPAGLVLAPAAYSAKHGSASHFPMSPAIRLVTHTDDVINAELRHADTRLSLTYARIAPTVVAGSITALELGEWGLRYWLLLHA